MFLSNSVDMMKNLQLPYGHSLSKREAEAETEAQPKADPALLHSGYYGYGLGMDFFINGRNCYI